MNKRELKKMILGQLAVELQQQVIIDGLETDKDNDRCWEVQQEIAEEFERRSKE